MAKKEPVEWITIEHAYYEKSNDWFWIVGIIGITAALLAIILGNLLFAVLIVIAAATVIIRGGKIPNLILIKLGPSGVRIGEKLYPYQSFKSFSIDEEDELPILTLVPKGFAITQLRFPIEEVDLETVRDYLLDHLDESYHEHSFAESIAHYLGL